MRYKLLGRSGLRVSELALGTMTFGEDWGWGAPHAECLKMFNAFSEAGGNFIDTSVNYTNGTSEKFVGEFIAPDRHRYVVATKYTLRDGNTNRQDPNAGGNARKNLVRSVEKSLRSLQTDYIDLYYLHAWDGMTPIEEVMRALDDLVQSGKVLYIGISDTPAWVIAKANMVAELRGWTRFVAAQLPYSLADRSPERDLLPMARADELAVAAWGVLGGGVLTGKYRQPGAVTRYSGSSERRMQLADQIAALASEIGCTPSQLAIAWVQQRPWHGASIIPILGARSLAQLQDNLGSLNVHLTPEQIGELDALSPIQLGFPHDFLAGSEVRSLIFGDTFPLTDNYRTS